MVSPMPDDITATARALEEEFWSQNVDQGCEVTVAGLIARAVVVERRRCADVARNATIRYEFDWRGMVDAPIMHRGRIADAIMAGTQALKD